MRFNPDIHRRHSIRLGGYDYASPGIYFVTICTAARRCCFDDPALRTIAEQQWRSLEHRFDHVTLDTWIVMPNHIHGLIQLDRPAAATSGPPATHDTGLTRSPTSLRINVVPGSLGAIMRAYKAAVSRRAARLKDPPELPIWQRGYWERVVRNQAELDAIRRYIATNPQRWAEDHDNLDALLARMEPPTAEE